MDAVTELQTRTWPVEGAARVPFWVYGDQDVYEREQERIFGGPNWSYVALEAEIPNPYDFIRANIDKPVVVTRDGNGSVNVFAKSSVATRAAMPSGSSAPIINGPTSPERRVPRHRMLANAAFVGGLCRENLRAGRRHPFAGVVMAS